MDGTSLEREAFLCRSDNIGVLVRDPESGACAAIDVPEAAPLLAALDRTGWTLTDILVTHRHGDHVEGIPEVKQRTGARVTAPARAGKAVPDVDRWVSEGDCVALGAASAEVWETPGHCVDHVSYIFRAAGIAFAGDTLFTLGCGRVMEAEPDVLWRSLQRFLDLPDDTLVFSGHDYVLANGRFALAAEPSNTALQARMREAEQLKRQGAFLIPTTMAAEKATNPFLRATEPNLAKAVDRAPGTEAAAVFAALRAWKNRF